MRNWIVSTLTIFAAFLPGIAQATSFSPREFPEAVKDAPIIVQAEVVASYANWGKTPGTEKRIYTYTDLKVLDVMKGDVNSRSIIARELGGVRDGVGMEVPGTARFKQGEETVVFLSTKNLDGSYDVRGMMMGKYEVKKDEDGQSYLSGGELASNEHSEHEREGQSGTDRPSRKWTLSDLRDLIHDQKIEPSRAEPERAQTVTSLSAPTANVSQAAPSPGLDQAPTLPENKSRSGGVGTIGMVALALLVFGILLWGVLR